MKKRAIKHKIELLMHNCDNENDLFDSLQDLLGELKETREKQSFIDCVFQKVGFFPLQIYNNELLLKEMGESNFAEEIMLASIRKNKAIK